MSDFLDIQTIDMTPDPENAKMEMLAKLSCQVLGRHYPLHAWSVSWAPGYTLSVKNLAMDQRYGFTVDALKAPSISVLEHAIMIAGGEILERMGMKRGAWNGEFADNVEGVKH